VQQERRVIVLVAVVRGCGTWSQIPGSICLCCASVTAFAGAVLPFPFSRAGGSVERFNSPMAEDMAADLSAASRSSKPPRRRRKAAAEEAAISVSSSCSRIRRILEF
jgi:hypothetical protein